MRGEAGGDQMTAASRYIANLMAGGIAPELAAECWDIVQRSEAELAAELLKAGDDDVAKLRAIACGTSLMRARVRAAWEAHGAPGRAAN